jgi:hypothetical protein
MLPLIWTVRASIFSSPPMTMKASLFVRKSLLEQAKLFAFGFNTQRSAAGANGSFSTQTECSLGNRSILRASE